jgi:ABC-type lipoprotein release transport system permease subunit
VRRRTTPVRDDFEQLVLSACCASVTLALVALAASLVPAYRACRVDPLTVLRAE